MAKRSRITKTKFDAIKELLNNGMNKNKVKILANAGTQTVSIIERCEKFEDYRGEYAKYAAEIRERHLVEKEEKEEKKTEDGVTPNLIELLKRLEIARYLIDSKSENGYYVTDRYAEIQEFIKGAK